MSSRAEGHTDDGRRPGLDALRVRAEHVEETLQAIAAGEVDTLLIDGPDGRRAFKLEPLDHPEPFEGTPNGRAELGLPADADLRSYATKLLKANTDLESFVYSVSHDLQAPLRAIEGFVRIISADYRDAMDAQGAELLDRVLNACERMSRMFTDLLSLSRIDRSELVPEVVDVSHQSEQFVDELRARDPNRDVQVSIEPGMTVIGASALVRIAVQNVIANAWKFTATTQGARISVVGRPGEVVVKDNGVGFRTDQREQLFRPFSRLHDPVVFPGTGIGLATVKRILERHGGAVKARGSEGEGATFILTFHSPLHAASSHATKEVRDA